MSTLRTARRLATVGTLALGLLQTVSAAAPARLVEESRVRIIGTQIASNWSEGRIRIVNGCTMVFLDKATPEGYTAMMLIAVRRLELQDAGQWRAMDVAALLAREPKDCQVEGAD